MNEYLNRNNNLLIVDDDSYYLDKMVKVLRNEGFSQISTDNGSNILDLLPNNVSLLIIEPATSNINGFELCKMIRYQFGTPVVMVTKYSLEETRIQGFLSGVDDYITKPFSELEFVLRIESVLRRTNQISRIFSYKDLQVDFENNSVYVNNKKVELTKTEYNILTLMINKNGMCASYDELMKRIWNDGDNDDYSMIRVNIVRLRKKLGDTTNKPKFIFNVHGKGYSFGSNA